MKNLHDSLVGKVITKLLIGPGEHSLVFETDHGDVIWEAEGDCCSESWFSDILGHMFLIHGKVSQVSTLDLPDWVNTDDGRGRQECDQAYGIKITTDKGIGEVIFRNSSNGYYGGHAFVSKFRGSDLVEIGADWSA